ncbi:hypothetical protein M427DRAFT_53701 [Gonapodya prolifera JEL478]|uniref:Uncharacterized protein n=1 Tax=Gonapodya prolifera (strain JEL478) TaxID=1344416 RepID=A0A139AP68_GONPJ|nr:hypothetical protein M427DRAFT_53701 [Gonapodya prolifera JEL478]|eukprot:KXS18303.1 hypothetical protein M427DRAFT_53701 [Gonapodya prolifera JEL478]
MLAQGILGFPQLSRFTLSSSRRDGGEPACDGNCQLARALTEMSRNFDAVRLLEVEVRQLRTELADVQDRLSVFEKCNL